jgi:hypothetical protein
MNKTVTVSAKMPEDAYAELVMRIPEGERSNFIRDAIIENLQSTPRPNKVLELEKVQKIESDLSLIKNCLADLEFLANERGKVNPRVFCVDRTDHAIIDHLTRYKGATTPELAETPKANRWLVLNHLKRIQRLSKQQLGRPIIKYYAGAKTGKKKAW